MCGPSVALIAALDDAEDDEDDETLAPKLFFAKQVVENNCATQELLSVQTFRGLRGATGPSWPAGIPKGWNSLQRSSMEQPVSCVAVNEDRVSLWAYACTDLARTATDAVVVHRREHLRQTQSLSAVRAKVWSRLVRRLGACEAKAAKRASDATPNPYRQRTNNGSSSWVVPASAPRKRAKVSASRPVALVRWPESAFKHRDAARQRVIEVIWRAIGVGLRADGVSVPPRLAAIVAAVEDALFKRFAAVEVARAKVEVAISTKAVVVKNESASDLAPAAAAAAAPPAAPKPAPKPASAPALTVAYRQQARALASNLRDRGNVRLRERILSAEMSASELAGASAAELANDDVRRKRSALDALRSANVEDQTSVRSVEFMCEKCQGGVTRVKHLISGNVSRKSEIWGASDAPTNVWAIQCVACSHAWRREVYD